MTTLMCSKCHELVKECDLVIRQDITEEDIKKWTQMDFDMYECPDCEMEK